MQGQDTAIVGKKDPKKKNTVTLAIRQPPTQIANAFLIPSLHENLQRVPEELQVVGFMRLRPGFGCEPTARSS